MEQRRLRLGDILDDYCPRERRVTNHAVVAMIEEDVKQTRCTTCDAEHAYKGGKAPRREEAEATGALYKEVLAGITDQRRAVSARRRMPTAGSPDGTTIATVATPCRSPMRPRQRATPCAAQPTSPPTPTTATTSRSRPSTTVRCTGR